MTDIADTKQHKVFHVSSRGPAIVVTPQGDTAGFGNADLKVERERVTALVQNGEQFPNLVVDLGDCNYVGSEMIGFINKIILANRDHGGSHAVVNVSDDMQEGIEIMHLEQIWNVEDERTAFRSLAHENVVQSARRNAKVIGLFVASLALVAVAVFVWSRIPGDSNVADYQRIAESWNEFQRRRRSSQDLGLASWKKDELERMQALEAKLDKSARTNQPARQHMLWAVRDYLPRIYDPNLRSLNDEAAAQFVEEMRAARRLVEAQYRIELPVLKLDRPSEEPGDPESGTPTGGSPSEDGPAPDTDAEPEPGEETSPDTDAPEVTGASDPEPESDTEPEAAEPEPSETP